MLWISFGIGMGIGVFLGVGLMALCLIARED